jgi:pimeloyl-ACP methyl ester carboxylesterase
MSPNATAPSVAARSVAATAAAAAPWRRLTPLLLAAVSGLLAAGAASAASPPEPCRLTGVETAALCGTLQRPLDLAQLDGTQITLHYAVLPAVARRKLPDPVFFFAGGPGQSAIALAGTANRLFARLGNRRDIVLIDQRGTGRSAPLHCDDGSPLRPLAEMTDMTRQRAELRDCMTRLQALPHGDLRHYTTTVAMQDAEAVRQALGAPRVNLVGGSYGTRAALEYMRQFPQAVRRVVIDGVAPPDMALPQAMSLDAQAALDAVFTACDAQPACQQAFPALRQDWQRLLASLPREVSVTHPVSGTPERLRLDRDMALGLVRAPLYVPVLASALPLAVHQAAEGRFEPLFGLASSMGGGSRAQRLAAGMHFSVICAEDGPSLDSAAGAAGGATASPDFGDGMARLYRDVCAQWPRGAVPADFYAISPAPAATLVLSGGADPVTPPRHGERSAAALGANARHVVVAQAGHGVMSLPCMRDVLYRFIDAPTDAAALQVSADCAAAVPRPGAHLPLLATRGAEGARP